MSSQKYKFLASRHIKFLRRCLTILPSGSVSYDTSRMTVLFFGLSGLDILDAISQIPEEEKKEIVEWIYSLQLTSEDGHEAGGFRGGHCMTNIKHDKNYCNGSNSTISNGVLAKDDTNDSSSPKSLLNLDVAHIAMTYSALASLLILGDDLSRVDKVAVLKHVSSLQGEDGSFFSNAGGSENDLRFVYCATVICYILGDMTAIDRESVINFILSCLGFAGALGQGCLQESHGGSTFCGVAALYLLGALDSTSGDSALSDSQREKLIRWLSCRQENMEQKIATGRGYDDGCNAVGGGLQGRPNKPADSCYTFWIGAAMKLLDCSHLLDKEALRDFVLSTQDPVVGGLGKYSSSRPDGLHTFLSISGLSLLELEDCLLPVHPALNITQRAVSHLHTLGMRT